MTLTSISSFTHFPAITIKITLPITNQFIISPLFLNGSKDIANTIGEETAVLVYFYQQNRYLRYMLQIRVINIIVQ